MHAFVTSKNVKWCHLIWPTLYITQSTLYSTKYRLCRYFVEYLYQGIKKRQMSSRPISLQRTSLIHLSSPCWWSGSTSFVNTTLVHIHRHTHVITTRTFRGCSCR